MRWAATAACALLFTSSCTIPTVVHDLDAEAPPAELGRPGLVRGFARVGAWAGALGGALVSVAVLPVTYPISLLADEPLGYSKDEFLLAPITGGASLGHFLLGAPPDVLHFVLYRGWVDEPPQAGFEFTPMQPPVGPGVEGEPGSSAESPPAESVPAESAPAESPPAASGGTPEKKGS